MSQIGKVIISKLFSQCIYRQWNQWSCLHRMLPQQLRVSTSYTTYYKTSDWKINSKFCSSSLQNADLCLSHPCRIWVRICTHNICTVSPPPIQVHSPSFILWSSMSHFPKKCTWPKAIIHSFCMWWDMKLGVVPLWSAWSNFALGSIFAKNHIWPQYETVLTLWVQIPTT